ALAITRLQVNIKLRKYLGGIFLQQFVDFFGEHAIILGIMASLNTRSFRIGEFTYTVLDKFAIDNKVCRSIPHVFVTTTTSAHMIVDTMLDFVGNKENGLFLVE